MTSLDSFKSRKTLTVGAKNYTYFSLPAGGDRSVNAVWSYETPYPAVSAIKDHLAFYPDRVDAIERLPIG